MNKIITLSAALLMAANVFAQTDVKLKINHLLDANPFAFNTEAQNDLGHKFKLSRLEYYISGISITHDEGQVTNLPDTYILVKANESTEVLLGNLDVTSIEAIAFSIGVDPSVNNADPTQWSFSHALAPKSPSMHWGWASGYRFIALEGKSGVNFSQDFQIHALGNKNYFEQQIPVSGEDVDGALVVTLNADYTKAVSGMSMESGLIEHSEDNQAATCLRLFQTSVFTNAEGEGNVLNLNDIKVENAVNVYPNPSNGRVTIQVADDRFKSATMSVINLLGERIKTISSLENSTELTIDTPGIYFLTINREGFTSTEKIIVQ
jgi:hypothetical protein